MNLRDELIKQVNNRDELYSLAQSINYHVGLTLRDCLNYGFDCNLFESKGKEIEVVVDFLHDELNTGHWSEVALKSRQAFTVANFAKCLILLKENSNLELCLKSLDIGILLGAPLSANEKLLTESASILTSCLSGSLKQINDRKVTADFSAYLSLKCEEIQTLSCPSLEYFNKAHFMQQLPVKLTGCMSHWPASTKWHDINYLLKMASERTVPIEIGSHYVDENWTQKLMTLREFIEQHYLNDSSECIGYLAQHNLFEQITELRQDICTPEYCCLSSDYENSEEPDINAWLGPKGTVSPLHYDPKNNILAQVYGTKQVVLIAPNHSDYLYPHEDRLLFNTARVNPLTPNLELHPDFSKAKMYKCLLQRGEMLYIPTKWWHHISALEKSFSVSFWWQ